MGKKALYPGTRLHGDGIQIRFTWNGKRYSPILRWKQTPANQQKASKLHGEIKLQIRAGIFDYKKLVEYFPEYAEKIEVVSSVPLFSEVAQDYMDTADVSPNTRTEYRKVLNKYWMPKLAPSPIDCIKPAELRKIVASIDWTSNKTRNNALIPLRGVFEMAVQDELIDRNPADNLKNLKHQKPDIDPFSQTEADKIIAEFYKSRDKTFAAYFEFAFWTGMRTSEILALTWGDVDWNEKTVRVNKAQSKGLLNNQTKTGRERFVILNDQAQSALKNMKSVTFLQGEQIFLSPRTGKPFATDKAPRVEFTAVLKKLGIRHRPAYNTRHTYATICLMAGMNPIFVADQLGHSKEILFKNYSKWLHGESSKAEMAKLKQIGLSKVVIDDLSR